MGKVFIEKSSLAAIGDAIREKTGGQELLSVPNGMVDAITGIQSSESSDDTLLSLLASYQNLFFGVTFPKENTIITLNSKNPISNSLGQCFGDTKNLKKAIVKGTIKDTNYVQLDAFARYSDCEEIDLSGLSRLDTNRLNTAFYSCKQLKKILGELDLTPLTNSNNASLSFAYCNSLEEVRFKENSIKVNLAFTQSANLSAESIQSIINGLADLTGATTQTITFHADVKAKLTDAQKTQITSKNWTLA